MSRGRRCCSFRTPDADAALLAAARAARSSTRLRWSPCTRYACFFFFARGPQKMIITAGTTRMMTPKMIRIEIPVVPSFGFPL